MSTGRFAKRDREKARQERAAAKRARRFGGREDDGGGSEDATAAPAGAARSQSDVLAALAALHDKYDAGRMTLEDFEEARAELVAQIQV
jgi:hypothetical protein